jgi:DNA excision repair protein ERCC-3
MVKKASKLDDLFNDSDDEDLVDYSDEEGQGLFKEDYSSLQVRKDASMRPLWVCHNGKIILEAFHEFHAQAQDFLITIAEPVTRPQRIHEFKLTAYSLYAAVSVGMQTDVILQVLDRFSKVDLPPTVVAFIKECTLSYGKVKLVLKVY